MAGLSASIMLFQAGLPETWTEWLDVNSARVLQTRHVLCFKTGEQAVQTELARLHDSYAGPPGNDWRWIDVCRVTALPDWLKWAVPPAPGQIRGTSQEIYEMLELCLPAENPVYLNSEGQPEELELPPRLTPAAQQALVDRTLRVAEISHSATAAAEYAFEVFQVMQAHTRLEPEDLPSAEGFYFAWTMLPRRGR